METTINKISDVEYDLEIRATAEDLAEELVSALKSQRSRTNLKGFRKGKVPINVVKKLYGKALAYGVAEKSIQETYESSVMKPSEHEVLGRPKITTLDYEMDGDLFAVVRFGVRPEINLAALEGEQISKLVQPVSEEDVEKELEAFLEQKAEFVDYAEAVRPEDLVIVDLQHIDENDEPIVGRLQEGLSFHLADKRVKDEFRDAVVGTNVGDVVTVTMSHDHEDGSTHSDRYLTTITGVKERIMPELTDELVKETTQDKFETVDAFRDELRREIEKNWTKQSRELLEGMIVERLLEMNEVEVPESVIELYLDSFVEDVKQQGKGEFPEGFDEVAFRAEMTPDAERQGRWMLLRDDIIDKQSIEVTDEQVDEYILGEAGLEGIDPQMVLQYYRNIPGMLERTKQRVISERVFNFLIEQFEVVEKDRDAFQAERDEALEAKRKLEGDTLSDDDKDRSSWWRKPMDKWNQWRNPR